MGESVTETVAETVGVAPAASRWHRVPQAELPDDGRVCSVEVDGRSLALSRCGDRLGALENHCPHQGGPLGEGSIEKGLLRCPWHGYDYDPVTGRPPGGLQRRGAQLPGRRNVADGVYVELPDPAPPVRTVGDTLVETLVAFGVTHVFGMVGPLQPRLRRRPAPCGVARRDHLRRDPPRGRGRVRGQRLRQADGPPRRVLRHRRPGLDQPAHRPVRRQARRLPGGRRLGPGAVVRPWPRRVPGSRPDEPCSPTSRCRRRWSSPAATTPSWPRSRSSGPSTGAAWRTSCCPTRCRCCPAQPAARPGGPGVGPGRTCPTRGSLRAGGRRWCATARRPVLVVGHGARGGARGGAAPWPSGSARRC